MTDSIIPSKSACSKRKRCEAVTSSAMQRCEAHPTSSNPPLECGVCMEPVKTRGMLDCCGHVFCHSCITKWTKRSSACPHCKREISIISKSDVLGKKVISKHIVKKRNLRDTLDREEFQQRRRQLLQRERDRSRHGFVPLHGSTFSEASQLLSVHQSIRENMMTRFSSTMRGLQDNMVLLNQVQPPMVPINFDLCNLPVPTMWTDLNLGLNTGITPPPSTVYQTHTFTLPTMQQLPFRNNLVNTTSPVQYANLITQELASTLASLSHADPSTILHAQTQNLLHSYVPSSESDRHQLPFFER